MKTEIISFDGYIQDSGYIHITVENGESYVLGDRVYMDDVCIEIADDLDEDDWAEFKSDLRQMHKGHLFTSVRGFVRRLTDN